MFLDRLETLSAFAFIQSVIPKGTETGQNCLFVRVENDKLILTGGGQFVTKKIPIHRPNTIEESAGINVPLPETFMIPIADLLSFMKMMQEHKTDCIKLAKNDPSYLFVEITNTELKSYDGKVVYEQPKFKFKDLESCFEIEENSVSKIKVISSDVVSVMSGFSKTDSVQLTFSGTEGLIHFKQEDYEALLLPPIPKPKEEKKKEQKPGDDQTTIDQ